MRNPTNLDDLSVVGAAVPFFILTYGTKYGSFSSSCYQASGVKVTDDVKDIISDMKVVKNDADQNERIRLVIFRIDDSEGAIVVDKVYRQKDLAGEADIFKFFVGLLDSKTCRYLMYDCHFETKESSKKEELVAVMW